MPDYKTASRTKDYHQAKLLKDHPEIVSIAPQLRLDALGRPTQEGVIVIGIKHIPPIRLALGVTTQPRAALPTRLPAITADGVVEKDQYVDVLVEDEGPARLDSHTAKQRPCPGGYCLGHSSGTDGTLGGVVRVGAEWRYILSNNHILAASNTGSAGDPIYQPSKDKGGTSADRIGTLERWVPVDLSGGNNEVDCALARVDDPVASNVTRHVYGIGVPAAVADAVPCQSVRKSGQATELTCGTIVSDNATIPIVFGGGVATFVNQLKYSRMADGGDSGALVWDGASLTVVGLHFASTNSHSYGNKITRVLALLGQAVTVHDARGQPTTFPAIDAGLTDPPSAGEAEPEAELE